MFPVLGPASQNSLILFVFAARPLRTGREGEKGRGVGEEVCVWGWGS